MDFTPNMPLSRVFGGITGNIINNHGKYYHLPAKNNQQGVHFPFVTITIDVAIGWLFEDGYAKVAARYFQTA